MIRKKKKYLRPRKLYEKSRIEEENSLCKKYALKNKKEIWKTLAKVNYLRRRAKELAKKSPEEQHALISKLQALGLQTANLSDILGLQIENLLNRRLSTIVVDKKLASTAKYARQLITHKKILISGRVVNSPSYLVTLQEEGNITIKNKTPEQKALQPEEAVYVEAEAGAVS